MLNGQGRKVIKERVGNDRREYATFKGFDESGADQFDQDWNRVADRLGFKVGVPQLEHA